MVGRPLALARHSFAAALFQNASAMSQDLFPTSVALNFHQIFVLMMMESDHCTKPSPAIPKSEFCGGQSMLPEPTLYPEPP